MMVRRSEGYFEIWNGTLADIRKAAEAAQAAKG